ncbi:MAG: hypothetical protein CW338_10300 [Clostridiales bacterium]|nr:hypothetical protein [Clostridiales bacterium]
MYSVFEQAEKDERRVRRMYILLGIALVFFVMAMVELFIILRSPAIGSASGTVLQDRIEDCLNGGKSAANEISATVTSVTSSKVGAVKGYVYAIDQLTLVCYDGKKDNRPEDLDAVIDLLYGDIKEFDSVIQQNKSTLGVKAKLSEHLALLEDLLIRYDLVSY